MNYEARLLKLESSLNITNNRFRQITAKRRTILETIEKVLRQEANNEAISGVNIDELLSRYEKLTEEYEAKYAMYR